MTLMHQIGQSRGSSRNFEYGRTSADQNKSIIGSSMTLDSNLFREKLLLNKEMRNRRVSKEEETRQDKLQKNYGIASILSQKSITKDFHHYKPSNAMAVSFHPLRFYSRSIWTFRIARWLWLSSRMPSQLCQLNKAVSHPQIPTESVSPNW